MAESQFLTMPGYSDLPDQCIPMCLSVLTAAERLVAVHVKVGLSNKEVAAALGKTEPTVKNQVGSILGKLGVPSRARLIALLWCAEQTAIREARKDCVVCGSCIRRAAEEHLSGRAVADLHRPASDSMLAIVR